MEGSVYTKWVESSGVQVCVERECRVCVRRGVCGESEWGLVVCKCVCVGWGVGCVCGVWRRECVVCEGREVCTQNVWREQRSA